MADLDTSVTDVTANAPASSEPSAPAPAPVEDTGPSLHDEMGKAFDEATANDTDEPEEETAAPDAAKPETFIDAKGVSRFKDGKFAGKAVADVPAADVAAAATDPAAPTVAAVEPPQYVPKEVREHYTKAAPEVQKWVDHVVRRADQHATRASNYEQALKTWQPVNETIAHYQDVIAGYGNDPGRAIQQGLSLIASLAGDPAAALRMIAKAHNIDPLDLVTEDQSSEVANMKFQLAEIARRDRAMEGQRQQQQAYADRSNQERQDQGLQQYYDDFLSDKDPGLIREITPDFHRQIRAYEKDMPQGATIRDLFEKAWHAAEWTNENARARHQNAEVERAKLEATAQAKTAAAKLEADRQAAARKARTAASINVRTAPANGRPANLEDAMGDAYDRAMAQTH